MTEEAICKIAGCGKRLRARGYCSMHYSRFMNHGDPLKVLRAGVDFVTRVPWSGDQLSLCSTDDCERVHYAKGMCKKHYTHANPGKSRRLTPEQRKPLASGADVSFVTAHKRVKKLFGPAHNHPCVDCGEQAKDWSYSNNDPDQMFDISGTSLLAYSLKPEHYSPRCRWCHWLYDGRRAGGHGPATLNEEKVREIRALVAAGHKYAEVAEQFGVGSNTIGRVARRDIWVRVI